MNTNTALDAQALTASSTQSEPTLVAGRSADFYLKLMYVNFPLALMAITFILYMFTLPAVSLTMTFVILAGITVLAMIALTTVGMTGLVRAVRRERAAGYTTINSESPEAMKLYRLNPRTGAVVRRPEIEEPAEALRETVMV